MPPTLEIQFMRLGVAHPSAVPAAESHHLKLFECTQTNCAYLREEYFFRTEPLAGEWEEMEEEEVRWWSSMYLFQWRSFIGGRKYIDEI